MNERSLQIKAILLRYMERHKEITGCDVSYEDLSVIFDIQPDELMVILATGNVASRNED